jgi:hypothetical protein
VFRSLNGKIREVLQFPDQTGPSKGIDSGMESMLLPQKNGKLRLFIHRWYQEGTVEEGEEEQYLEIYYNFDPDQEKYIQLGKEKRLPTKLATAEWSELSQ